MITDAKGERPVVINMPSEELASLYEGKAFDIDGNSIPVHSQIAKECAEALYHTVRALRPKVAVEIGMAFGGSTLAILTALKELGEGGRLISIDPGQFSGSWRGAGVAAVRRAGFSGEHELIELPDYRALPALMERSLTIDFAYIDGYHSFDYVVLDAIYLDKMLSVGGILAFNDFRYPSVQKATGFLTSHRRYEQMSVGLEKDYRGRKPWKTLVRRLFGIPNPPLDAYFKKIASFEPASDFFVDF